MYITNWDFTKYNFGEYETVECIEAPPPENGAGQDIAEYKVGETYLAQKMHPFGNGWIVVIKSHGKLHDGATFTPENFRQHFRVCKESAATA